MVRLFDSHFSLLCFSKLKYKLSILARNMRHNARQSDNGRLYTRGRIIRFDELVQTFVARLVIRLWYKDGHKTDNTSSSIKAEYNRALRWSCGYCLSYIWGEWMEGH